MAKLSSIRAAAAVLGMAAALSFSGVLNAEIPEVGSKAPDFTLSTPEGRPVKLSDLTAHRDVVLIVLRGYPGYQCPYCVKQAHDFEVHSKEFAEHGFDVLLVYPGPRGQLDEHAREFLAKEESLPEGFHLVIDPDYAFTNLYGLRWDAPQETAYPSTFLIDRRGKVFFRKVTHGHGDRTTAEEMLAQIARR